MPLSLPSIPSADETVLNVLFYDKIKLISEAWNYCYNREYGSRKLHEKDIKNLHVCGSDKSKNDTFFTSHKLAVIKMYHPI